MRTKWRHYLAPIGFANFSVSVVMKRRLLVKAQWNGNVMLAKFSSLEVVQLIDNFVETDDRSVLVPKWSTISDSDSAKQLGMGMGTGPWFNIKISSHQYRKSYIV